MAKDWNPDFDAIPLDESLILTVAWKAGKELKAGDVNVAGDMETTLRDACGSVLDRVATLEPKKYSPDTHLYQEEFMTVPSSVFADDQPPALDVIDRAGAHDLVSATDLPSKPLHFYAVVVGDDPDRRVAFVRKTNPRKSGKPGRWWATLGETLTRVDDEVFMFDERFDIIHWPDGLVVLNQNAFELIFRDIEALADRYPDWVADITQSLPMDDDVANLLVDAVRRDSRLAGRPAPSANAVTSRLRLSPRCGLKRRSKASTPPPLSRTASSSLTPRTGSRSSSC